MSEVTIDTLLKRVFMFLEDGDWKSADEYCEKILDIDPEHPQAYLGKLMVELQVCEKTLLKNCVKPFDTSKNYQKILRFADENLITELKGYLDSINERNNKAKKKTKKGLVIVLAGICICLLLLATYKFILVPHSQYKEALAEIDKGNYVSAYQTLNQLGNYKDCEELRASIKVDYELMCMREADVGELVLFGAYEQDNNLSNGQEDIEWLVLKKNDDSIFLLSRYILEFKEFDSSSNVWEKSSLRKWLNGDFIDTAFSENESNLILTPSILTKNNDDSFVTNLTEDKVFLLTRAELIHYFNGINYFRYYLSESSQRVIASYGLSHYACEETVYSRALRGYTIDEPTPNPWWLRSPVREKYVDVVTFSGTMDQFKPDGEYGVRPALIIKLK